MKIFTRLTQLILLFHYYYQYVMSIYSCYLSTCYCELSQIIICQLFYV